MCYIYRIFFFLFLDFALFTIIILIFILVPRVSIYDSFRWRVYPGKICYCYYYYYYYYCYCYCYYYHGALSERVFIKAYTYYQEKPLSFREL